MWSFDLFLLCALRGYSGQVCMSALLFLFFCHLDWGMSLTFLKKGFLVKNLLIIIKNFIHIIKANVHRLINEWERPCYSKLVLYPTTSNYSVYLIINTWSLFIFKCHPQTIRLGYISSWKRICLLLRFILKQIIMVKFMTLFLSSIILSFFFISFHFLYSLVDYCPSLPGQP